MNLQENLFAIDLFGSSSWSHALMQLGQSKSMLEVTQVYCSVATTENQSNIDRTCTMVILLSTFGLPVPQLTTMPQLKAGNTTSTFSANISSSTITFSSASAMLNLAHSASIVL